MKPALAAFSTIALLASSAFAEVSPETSKKVYDAASPSVVAVQYTFESELGRRELTFPGIVVSDDGLVMISLYVASEAVPDVQMKEFKIIVPKNDTDDEEIDATFQGRDERARVAYVKAKPDAKKSQQWKAVKFEDTPLPVGQPVLGVGVLPKMAGYKPYLTQATIAAELRGDVRQLIVSGGLGNVGSPVFNLDGKAIGVVPYMPQQPLILNDKNPMLAVINPPFLFTPASELLASLKDPPTPDHPIKTPWMGVVEMQGLAKDEADYFGLTNQPAVQVGAVIPGAAAEKAGLKQGDIIVKVNGQPIRRGDQPEELPSILRQTLLAQKPGDEVTLTVLSNKGEKPRDLKLTLEEQPARANTAKRYWADDTGFGVRDLVFVDTYVQKLPRDTKGVVVSVIKPQGAGASARLQDGDLVLQLNGQTPANVDEFKQQYEEFRKSKPREAVVLVVRREGREETIRVEPPQ